MRKQSPRDKHPAKKKTKKRKLCVPSSFLECQSLTHVVGFPPQNEIVTTPVASEVLKEIFLERFVKEIVKPFQPDRNTKHGNTSDGKTSNSTSTVDSDAGYYHVMVGGKLVKKRRISKESQPSRNPSPESSQTTVTIDDRLALKKRIWKENIVVGTNQCLRLLETLGSKNEQHSGDTNPTAVTTIPEGDASEISNHPDRKFPSLVVLAKDVYPPTMCSSVPVLTKILGIPLLLLPGKASLELGRALNAKRASVLIFCCGNGAGPTSHAPRSDPSSEKGEQEMKQARRAMASFVSFIADQMPQSGPN